MSKQKTAFICQECGYESASWLGKCPACNGWGTLVEERKAFGSTAKSGSGRRSSGAGLGQGLAGGKPVALAEVETTGEMRFSTGMQELDRVLGGGVVQGSLVLVGGDPGIGKSTLLLQVCEKAGGAGTILYVSGEESVRQVKLRADRLGVANPKLLMVSETSFEKIEEYIRDISPALVIIDSIQTVYREDLNSAPGSVSQVREATAGLLHLAKGLGTAVMIVGHVTKEGAIAGPRVLEHMVDTVLYFEGERHLSYRVLRAVKNRFGSTNELGIFEMRDAGLVEVPNPSMLLLSGRPEDVPGSAIIVGMEGTRPMMMEIQALVCPTSFGTPRRMATGFDYNRVVLLIAVLEKRIGMQLHAYDSYVNVTGGIRIDEPAADLGIVAAIASSFKNKPLDAHTIFIGEVGLTGEIRAVSQIDKRVIEAGRAGYKRAIVPSGNVAMLKQQKIAENCGIAILGAENVQEALSECFD